MLKLRFRVGELDPLDPKKEVHTSSRVEEEGDAQTCSCSKAIESRTHLAGECEMHKEEQDVLEEETREVDECDMEDFDTLDSSEKNDRYPRRLIDGGHRRAKQEGDTTSTKKST